MSEGGISVCLCKCGGVFVVYVGDICSGSATAHRMDSGEEEVGKSLSGTPAEVMVLCWWWVGVGGYQESVGSWGEGKSTFDPMARNYLIFR